MSNTLLDNTDWKKRTALDILQDVKAFELFSSIGKVVVIGSLRLDVMYRNDIDLFVLSDDIHNTKAKEVTKRLLDSNKFQTVAVADYQTYPENDFPKGYYWELIVVKNNEKWKFDIWYLRPDEEYTKLVLSCIESFEKILKEHPEKREIILKIKEAYFDGIKYKDKVKSIDIYKAVLENSIDSVDSFTKFIK
ncbi:MAG TPA: hypothetical protein PLV59_01970 [Candidatus Dojkabacteria bacterium]|nr:hypothetical protein [Candidatus Dojkabacteria bacterium]